VKTPDVFDGTKTSYKDWKRSVRVFLYAPENKSKTVDEKIHIVYSYIKGPKVGKWSENFWEKYFDEANEEWSKTELPDMKKLWEKLDTHFEDEAAKPTVRAELENIKMEKFPTAQEFFYEFEILTARAGYDLTSEETLERLFKNSRREFVNRVADMRPKIVGYENWK
ncbi:hypothetical protein K474DRAFT_1559743, partial [Panus rudis PR-1116 ss-1]